MNSKIFEIFGNKENLRLISFAAIGTLIVSVFVGLQSYESYRIEFEKAEVNLKNLSTMLEFELHHDIYQADLVIKNVLDTIEAKGFSYKWTEQSLFEILSDRIKDTDGLEGLKVIDKEGFYIGTENGKHPQANLSDRIYFQEQKTNSNAGLVLSNPIRSKTTNNWIIVLSRRRNLKDGSFNGIVLATIPIKRYQDSFAQLNIGENGVLTLFSMDDYTLIARKPFTEELIGKSLKNNSVFYKKIFGENLRSGIYNIHSKIDNIKRLHSFQVSQDGRFVLVVGLALADFLSDWQKRATRLFLGILGIIIFFWVGLFRYLLLQNRLRTEMQNRAKTMQLATLGEMASGMAHEINNPLAIIIGKSNLLQNFLVPTLPDDQNRAKVKSHLRAIIESAERISKIVKDLKYFCRMPEQDPMTEHLLSDVLHQSFEFCRSRMTNSGIDFRLTEIPEGRLYCKGSQLAQVFLNILNNACDAVDAVDANNNKWIQIHFQNKNAHTLQIRISDSGSGVPKNIANKIMEPFFTTKEIGKGTGLGLSASLGIVKEHGGTLFLDETTKNTTFVIELPFKACQTIL
jgi:signal transduction histidine kinase